MRIALTVFAITFLLAGCTSEKKVESVCLDLIKTIDADPTGLKINGVHQNSAAMTTEIIDEYFDQRNPKGLSSAQSKLKDMRLKYMGESKGIFVEVDYTTKNAIGGPVRDNALCRYVQWEGGATELLTFTINNVDYGYEKLFNLNLLGKMPKGLDTGLKLK